MNSEVGNMKTEALHTWTSEALVGKQNYTVIILLSMTLARRCQILVNLVLLLSTSTFEKIQQNSLQYFMKEMTTFQYLLRFSVSDF